VNGKAEGEASGQYVFGDERTADPSTSLRFGRDDKEESSAFKRQVQWRGEKAGPRSTTLRASSPLCCSSVGDKGSGDAFPRMLWPGRGAQRVPPLRFAPVGACDFFDLLHTKVGTQDCILGDFQPSLRDCSWLGVYTQHCVLGYFQPPLRGSKARPYLDATEGTNYQKVTSSPDDKSESSAFK